MTPLIFLATCIAGGIGAVLRFALDGAIRSRWPTAFPVGTAFINISGSFVLGLLTGLALSAVLLPEDWTLVLGTGLMGGYTTFSTASVETMRLLQNRAYGKAAGNGLGVLLLAIGAALLGIWAGSISIR